MLEGIFLGLASGILIGTLTGLLPGIHMNLVASLFLAYTATQQFSVEYSIAFIASLTIIHTMLDFIPSLLLGVPEENNLLALLPSHELVKQGKGHEACILALQGMCIGIVLFCLLAFPFYFIIPHLITLLTPFVPYLLIGLCCYLIFRDQPLASCVIFALAGLAGLLTFSLPVKEPLLPLLSGLFGIAGLLSSLQEKTNVPEQHLSERVRLSHEKYRASILSTSIISPLCSFLPGIGSGHATTFAAELSNPDRRTFIVMTGITATLVTALSFITLFAIGKARTGSAAFIQTIIPHITPSHITLLIASLLLTSLLGVFIYLYCAKKAIQLINKINYRLLTILTLVFVLVLNILLTNFTGLLVLCASTCIGYCCIQSGVRRITLMACLILPSITYYLFS